MSNNQRSEVFGRRPRQHTVIIASGDRIRHFTVSPWMAVLAGSIVGVFAIGYLLATSYLVLRDDLLGTTSARQTRIERAYEERIATLRAQVDRITSRQLLDQQAIKERVQKLYERQQALTSRHGQIDPLLERARLAGLLTTTDVPVPSPRPPAASPVHATGPSTALDAIAAVTRTRTPSSTEAGTAVLNAYAPVETSSAPVLRPALPGSPASVVGEVARSLDTVEGEQMEKLRTLTRSADEAAGAIRALLETSGLPRGAVAASATGNTDKPLAPAERDGMGGPYIRIDDPAAFNAQLGRLDAALDRLESVRNLARKLPFGHPVSTMAVTSPFGRRDDPFLEGMAFHPGIDFRAAAGSDVHSTGAGTVVHAGWAGGYGNMVEIDHGNGVTTRYGHLSEIAVHKGDHVTLGAVLGESGSTGRSTGPHLHYEVRLGGHPVDPSRLLDAGRKLQAFIRS